ncbi:MAG TPA: 23S rRNA (guanosine(2251)-2'-O)-methyltransferase RlmB, partial [Pseudomonas sp.]|nr:23S rRNA (guanosine(2251)-2'-O)-methyltransferase RlmB [Pseudomonas sp.]
MSDLERVFGLHAVQALLDRHPKRIKRLLLQAGRLNERQQALLALAERQGVALQRVAGDELDAQAEGVHQGVVAEVVPSQLWSEEMLGHMLDRL